SFLCPSTSSGYLVDDILTKLDRASMSVSLESRVPLLDHRIIEASWRISTAQMVGDGTGKPTLKKLLSNYLPDHLTNRPKAGFGLPIEKWLASDLRGWAEEMLSESQLNAHGLFKKEIVKELWNGYILHGHNYRQVWNLLMFQSWYEHNRQAITV
ncbi:MAG: asparagine synthase C-terminal domain-containing protein, partial [Pseudomonadota bacterium]